MAEKTEAEYHDENLKLTGRTINFHLTMIRKCDRERVMDVALRGICRVCWRDTGGEKCHCTNDE